MAGKTADCVKELLRRFGAEIVSCPDDGLWHLAENQAGMPDACFEGYSGSRHWPTRLLFLTQLGQGDANDPSSPMCSYYYGLYL
jgi:hypothetical protein